MRVVPSQLPFMVADAEKIEIWFADGDLVLRFVDIAERPVEHRFLDVLAFRWSDRPTIETPRDDMDYEVIGSAWLADELHLNAHETDDFAHYVLCFNAAKVLEVLSRR